jgi:mRNA-degrading endonuclease toxin of MazEF toxin-antitoxin module
LSTVVIVPLSTRLGEIWPLRLKLAMPGMRESFAVVPGLRQVSKTRLMDPSGPAPAAFLRALDEAIRAYLSGSD